jgi:hypothetical protein
MAQTCSTQTIAQELETLGLPFADLLAHRLTALLTGRNASVHQVATLLPGEENAEVKRQQIRRFLDQPALLNQAVWAGWATSVAALLPPKVPGYRLWIEPSGSWATQPSTCLCGA